MDGIDTIGIDKFDVELTTTLIPLIHLIAFILNNSSTWLVSWENSQDGILSQDPPKYFVIWIVDDWRIKWTDSVVHVWESVMVTE